jgi:hypothetical protein
MLSSRPLSRRGHTGPRMRPTVDIVALGE